MDFVIIPKLHMCQVSGRSEKLFFREIPPNFGKKVDFFPLPEFFFDYFPKIQNIISPELYIKKIKIKIRETFWITHSLSALRASVGRNGESQLGT